MINTTEAKRLFDYIECFARMHNGFPTRFEIEAMQTNVGDIVRVKCLDYPCEEQDISDYESI